MNTKYFKILTLGCLLSGLTMAAVACGGDDPVSPVNPDPTPNPDETPTQTDYLYAKVGEVLPDWKEGTLDIHSISTGRGESYLFILPDGTTMLIDAAGSLLTKAACEANKIAEGPLAYKPNGNISSGTVIADYVKHFNPHGKTVDYWMNSHFDTDHMGNFPETYASVCPVSKNIKKHPEGDFYVSGINEVGTLLDFKKIIDRGYTTPIDRSGEKRFKDYIKFLDWTKKTKGTVYEPANVGHNDQVVMNYNPSKYDNLDIRILCAGGWYWTGSGQDKKCNLPLDAKGNPDKTAIQEASPKENIYSVGVMLNFGKFDYFTAGDLQYNGRSTTPWLDSEAPLIPVVKPVEVMKACHHGTANTNSPELMKVLAPKNILVSPWRDVQPRAETFGRFLTVSPNVNIFTTGIDDNNKNQNLSPYFSNVKSWGGHIVVRVAPNGDYKIFILDDNNQDYIVKSIHGTYHSL